jgi:hypothetical protein
MANHSARAVKGMKILRPLERWGRGFESRSRHGCLCVTIYMTTDGIWTGEWIYWPLIRTTHNYTLQITVTHGLVSQSITVSTSHFLATVFNTGTITVLLNYTLRISHIQFSFCSRTLANILLQNLPHRTHLNWLLTQAGGHFTSSS